MGKQNSILTLVNTAKRLEEVVKTNNPKVAFLATLHISLSLVLVIFLFSFWPDNSLQCMSKFKMHDIFSFLSTSL